MPMPLLRTVGNEALADCTAVGRCNLAKCLTQRWSEDDTGCQETCSLADGVDFALVTVRVLTMRCASPPYREPCYHWWPVSISSWYCLPAKNVHEMQARIVEHGLRRNRLAKLLLHTGPNKLADKR